MVWPVSVRGRRVSVSSAAESRPLISWLRSCPVTVLLGAAALVWLAGAWLTGLTGLTGLSGSAHSPVVVPVAAADGSPDDQSAGGAPKPAGASQPHAGDAGGSAAAGHPVSSASKPDSGQGSGSAQSDAHPASHPEPQPAPAGEGSQAEPRHAALTQPAPANTGDDGQQAAPKPPGKPDAGVGDSDTARIHPVAVAARPQPSEATAASGTGAARGGQPSDPSHDCQPGCGGGAPAVPPTPTPPPSAGSGGGPNNGAGGGGAQPGIDNDGRPGAPVKPPANVEPQQPNGQVVKNKDPRTGTDPPADAPTPNPQAPKPGQPDTNAQPQPGRPSAATWTPPKDEEGFFGSIRHAWRSIVGGDTANEPTDGGYVPAHDSTPAQTDEGRARGIDMVQGELDAAAWIPGPVGRGAGILGGARRGLQGLEDDLAHTPTTPEPPAARPPAPDPGTQNAPKPTTPKPTEDTRQTTGAPAPRVLPRPGASQPKADAPGGGPARPAPRDTISNAPSGGAGTAPTGTAGAGPRARPNPRATGRDNTTPPNATAGARPGGNREPLTNSTNSNHPNPRANNTPNDTNPSTSTGHHPQPHPGDAGSPIPTGQGSGPKSPKGSDEGNAPKQIEGGPKVNASWGGVTNYKKGGPMTAIEHINYRHGYDSGFKDVSRFDNGTSISQIKGYVDDALRRGTVTPKYNQGTQNPVGYDIVHNTGKVIGTAKDGTPVTGIKVHVLNGKVTSAYPVAAP